MGGKGRRKTSLGIDYEMLLKDFYSTFAPEKLGDIRRVLKHFKGREDQMIRAIETKYGVRLKPEAKQAMTKLQQQRQKEEASDDDDDYDDEEDEDDDGMSEYWRRNGSFALYDDEEDSGMFDQKEVFDRAYRIARKRQDKQRWGRAKIMVVGRGAAGKSSTVRSLLGIPFEEEWKSTVGIDLSVTHTGDWKNRDKNESVFQMLMAKATAAAVQMGLYEEDGPGAGSETQTNNQSEKQESLVGPESASEGRKSMKILSSLRHFLRLRSEKKKSSKSLDDSLPRSLETGGSLPRNKSYRRSKGSVLSSRISEANRRSTVGTVCTVDSDLVEKEMDPQERVVLNIWDYGGQPVFHALHNLFLTRYGIYVLVFDMRSILSSDDREAALDEMRFWLHSIQSHAAGAHVVIVGTYFDEVRTEEELDTIDEILQQSLELEIFQVMPNEGDDLVYFPLDNSSKDPNRANQLREAIEMLALNEDYVQQEVSLSWAKLLDALITRRGRQVFHIEKEVMPIAAKLRISEPEVHTLLSFFHQLGMVVFMENSDELAKFVITDPQWLADNLTSVVKDHQLHFSIMEHKNVRNSGLEEDWASVQETGVTSMQLLRKCFSKEYFEYLFSFARETLLLSMWDDNQVVIPSLFPLVSEPPLRENVLRRFQGWTMRFAFDYCPDVLFQRFLCLLMSLSRQWEYPAAIPLEGDTTSPSTSSFFSKDLCVFRFGAVHLALSGPHDHEIAVHFNVKPDNFAHYMQTVHDAFHYVHETYHGAYLKWDLYLSFPTGAGTVTVPYEALLKAASEGESDALVSAVDESTGAEEKIELSYFSSVLDDEHARLNLARSRFRGMTPRFAVYVSHDWLVGGEGVDRPMLAKSICNVLLSQGITAICGLDLVAPLSPVRLSPRVDACAASLVLYTRAFQRQVECTSVQTSCRREFARVAQARRKLLVSLPIDQDVDAAALASHLSDKDKARVFPLPSLEHGKSLLEDIIRDLAEQLRIQEEL